MGISITARIATAALCLLTAVSVSAQWTDTLLDEDASRQDHKPHHGYTEEKPLIYEGARDLWPYSFLNEKGEADGFNIDLVKLLLGKLGIPYKIYMKARMTAFNDLKAGRSDLMIGLTAGFHEDYGYYSNNSVTLFTQSILSPKSHPTEVHNFRDLATHRVYVNDSSLCHHLMVDYGWGANAIPTRNISETIQQMSTDEEGELVWNTLSLQWLLNKYQITNLQVTPVDMPHGEYKFMSGDAHLIHLLDSVFADLNSKGELEPLYSKWFYPNREESVTPQWVWWAAGALALLLALALFYTASYRIRAGRITSDNTRRNRRLALVLETSGVRVWTYDVAQRLFTWRNEFGQPAYVYTPDEFATRYSPADYERLTAALEQIAHQPADKTHDVSLDIRAKDAREDGDTEMHDFIVTLAVLQRDKQGRVTTILGTKKDVTAKCRQQQLDHERTLRYQALFDMPTTAILFFGNDGHLINMNKKACQLYCCDHDEALACHPTCHDLMGLDPDSLAQADGLAFCTILQPNSPGAAGHTQPQSPFHLHSRTCMEMHLIAVDDEDRQPIGIFAVCHDRTALLEAQQRLDQATQRYHDVGQKEKDYVATIDHFIRNGNIRLASYSPASHTLTIADAYNHTQHSLTQTRLMTLVQDNMRKKAMHIINRMDQRDAAPVEAELPTTLRVGGRRLWLYTHLLPQRNAEGHIDEYIGIMRDISELKDIEAQLAEVEARTQEVEDTKNSFVKNMMHEIRTPLRTIVSNTDKLRANGADGQTAATTQAIISNAEQLTHIIGNILTLSRIEAHMVEIVRHPVDLALFFSSLCEKAWVENKTPGVRYLIDNPFEQLVVDIDIDHLADVIYQVALNAVQHTRNGAIRARYDYVGRRLVISIEDTGEGIAPEQLAAINAQLESGRHTSSGLGLPISKELMGQMGGNIEISSEPGVGTAVWITLPCTATTVKRKKLQ